MIGALTRRPWLLLAALAVLSIAAIVVQAPGRAEAHPLGNFTVNRYSRIEIYSDVIRVHYVRDLAEIPRSRRRTASTPTATARSTRRRLTPTPTHAAN